MVNIGLGNLLAITKTSVDLSSVESFAIQPKKTLLNIGNAYESNYCNAFENYIFQIKATHPGGRELKQLQGCCQECG